METSLVSDFSQNQILSKNRMKPSNLRCPFDDWWRENYICWKYCMPFSVRETFARNGVQHRWREAHSRRIWENRTVCFATICNINNTWTWNVFLCCQLLRDTRVQSQMRFLMCWDGCMCKRQAQKYTKQSAFNKWKIVVI